MVMLLAVLATQHFRPQFAAEDFQVENLVAQAAVEALAVGVFPRGTRLDIEALQASNFSSEYQRASAFTKVGA